MIDKEFLYSSGLLILKTVNIKSIKRTMKQLKSKKSAGNDGLSQQQLKAGVAVLAGSLRNIIKHLLLLYWG